MHDLDFERNPDTQVGILRLHLGHSMMYKVSVVRANHCLKRFLFHYYAVISVAGFLATILIYFVKPFDWEALVAIEGGILSFAFGVQKQQIGEVNLFKQLFQEFNSRYDGQNEKLNCIYEQPAEKPLEDDERNALFNYFNLCGEEYLYFTRGFIYPEVWRAWKNGMRFFRQNPRIKKLWDEELKTCSYYGLSFTTADEKEDTCKS